MTKVFRQYIFMIIFLKALNLFGVGLLLLLASTAALSLPSTLDLFVRSSISAFLLGFVGSWSLNKFPDFKTDGNNLWVSCFVFFWLHIPWDAIDSFSDHWWWGSKEPYREIILKRSAAVRYLLILGASPWSNLRASFFISPSVSGREYLFNLISQRANIKV